jgi:hypothetical protein
MTLSYNIAAGNARLAAGLTAPVLGQSVDGGPSFGQLVIGASNLSGAVGVLCTLTLHKPSFTIASKLASLAGTPISATPSANGTAALAEFRDSNGTTIGSTMTVGVGGSGADIILSTTAISTAVPIQLSSGAIQTQ